MKHIAELFCRTYVHTSLDQPELIADIAHLLSGSINGNTIVTPSAEIDVLRNDAYDELQSQDFPDGFRYAIDMVALPMQAYANHTALIANMLTYLWAKDVPAVAACDYANELPHNGGYANQAVPWVRVQAPVVTV